MESFTKVECFKCGVIFAVSSALQRNWERDETSFYCPGGHRQSYTESTADILQKRIKSKDSDIRLKNAEIYKLERQIVSLKRKPRAKKKTKIKKK